MSTRSPHSLNPFGATDPDLPRELLYVESTDGALSSGVLVRPERSASRICAYLMHPRGACSRHYLGPLFLERGIPLFGHDSRYVNNDMDCLHESLLLDIAAGLRRLRELGFDQFVLIGNSGGGSLFSYYQAQASMPPEERVTVGPAGDSVNLRDEEMPEATLFISLAAHLGEGKVLQGMLDPSVVEESDPESYDPRLDMYHPANGYQPWPQPSRYDPDWLLQYRAAQEARAHRLDAQAQRSLAEPRTMMAVRDGEGFSALGADERMFIERRSEFHRFMTIYRSVANPNYLDPTLDPSNRPLGTIFAPASPMLSNWGTGGLARVMTPRGWLSTWSGPSSKADFLATIGQVRIPTLITAADGDTDIFLSQQRALLAASGAEDKRQEVIEGASHFLMPTGGGANDLPHPRGRGADLMAGWIRERLHE